LFSLVLFVVSVFSCPQFLSFSTKSTKFVSWLGMERDGDVELSRLIRLPDELKLEIVNQVSIALRQPRIGADAI
jgi:hypothetical protein